MAFIRIFITISILIITWTTIEFVYAAFKYWREYRRSLTKKADEYNPEPNFLPRLSSLEDYQANQGLHRSEVKTM